MKRVSRAIPALILLSLAACASGPLTSRRVPDWVLAPPSAVADYEYFVASASSADDVAKAEEAAGYALLSQINQALGVEITVETSAEARSTLDTYEANLVQQVTQRGSGQVQGLRIADRYIAEQAGGVMVYLLGEYERSAFEAERADRRALLRQQEELLTGPETDGDRLVAAGRLTQGILRYGQAAAAAAESSVRTANVVLERALQKASQAATRLALTAVAGPDAADVGRSPSVPVTFALSDDRGNPVAGATLEISHLSRSGTRDVVRTTALITDENGRVQFVHPAPQRVGDFTVTARLEAEPLLALLDGLPASVRTQVQSLKDAVLNVRAVHRFVVLSRAREVPTAVLVQDLDAAGLPMPQGMTGEGIVESLAQSGFSLRSVAVDAGQLVGRSTSELVSLLRGQVPADVRRVIVGTAGIADFQESDGFLVKVAGSVTALDLDSGTVLYSASGVKNARSRTADRAISTAFSELGRQLAEELASNLP